MRVHTHRRLAVGMRAVAVASSLAISFAGPISCYTARSDLGLQPNAASREVMPIEGDAARYANVYDAIQHLRPEYLQQREGPNAIVPAAYVNGVRLADASMLRLVPISWVVEVKWVRPNMSSALYQFRSHLNGGIFVTTK